MQKGDFSKDYLEHITRDEPQWMREKRLEAYSLYESLPMPHTTDDDTWRRTVDMRTQDYWRRTRRHLRGFAVENYRTTANGNGSASVQVNDGAGVYVQVDRTPQHTFLSPELVKKDVYFADLHTAIKERSDLIRDYFMTKGGHNKDISQKWELRQYKRF